MSIFSFYTSIQFNISPFSVLSCPSQTFLVARGWNITEGNFLSFSPSPSTPRNSLHYRLKCLTEDRSLIMRAPHTKWYLFLVSKECKSPDVPKNGEKFGSEFSVGKRVRYTCDTGFVLEGSMVIECLKNRTWSAGVPLCKGKDKRRYPLLVKKCTNV